MRCDHYIRLGLRVLRKSKEEVDKVRGYRNLTPTEWVQHFWLSSVCFALLEAADDLYALEHTADMVPETPIRDLDSERDTGDHVQWSRKGRYTFTR